MPSANNVNQDYVDIVAAAMEYEGIKFPPVMPEDVLGGHKETEREFPKVKFNVRYHKYNMSIDGDVEELERTKTSIVNGEYIGAREEWVHTKDGDSFVVLSWLVPIKPPPDPNIPRPDPNS